MAPPPPPALPDELLEEIFLRLPPDEPACLVRASLASKEWLELLTGTAFGSRYRDFHGAPPVLGFFYSGNLCFSDSVEETKPDPLFVSTKFRARIPDHDGGGGGWCSGFDTWDCRHGRVVLGDWSMSPTELFILDPMTGCWWELSLLGAPEDYVNYGAAVLCEVANCDHRSCHDGPFRVVLVGIDAGDGDDYVAYAHVSLPVVTGESCRLSSECQWSKPCSGLHLGCPAYFQPMPPVLIQDTLYFMFVYDDDDDERMGILKYDLRSKCLSAIDGPLAETNNVHSTILVGMQDGSLGFAHLDGLTLKLWSMQMRSDGVGLWTECTVIYLNEFLPIGNPKRRLGLLGSVEGRDIILMSTDLGIYEISLKSLEWKKIWKSENFQALVPYMSFYDP